MRNVTTKFKQLLSQNKRNYINSLNITLADGTQLNVANDNIMDGGLDVDDAVSQDNEFTALGSTIVGSCNVILYDITEKYSDYDFLNARVVVKTNLYGADSSDLITFGTYTVDSATYSESSVSLTLLDNMCQFDREYASYSIYTSTTTLRDIVYDACYKCGVLYDSSMSSFPNYNFVVPQAPKDDCTYREVIGWCATLAGCFARMTSDGRLKFDWFNVDAFNTDEALSTDGGIFDSANPYATGDNVNGGTFNPWNDPSSKDGGAFTDRNGIHYLASLSTQSIDVDDVVITGIQVTYDVEEDNSTTQETALLGTDDYVVSITGNPFITESNYQSVLSFLQPTLIGLTFRPCNITIPNNPTIEAGDIGYVWDTKGIQHRILITRATFNPSELQNVVCGAESPGKNNSGRLTSVTKAFAKSRRMLNEEKSIREQIVEDFQRQIANGSGLYFTRVATGSSEIIYGHDKPTLAESKVVLKVSTAGIAMTGDYTGNDSTTTWYGQTFDGTWLANIISTMNLFFNYAHGGTLKLGGQGNGNGILEVYDANGTQIGKWDNAGVLIDKGTIQGPTIIAGGLNDEYGRITVKDNDGNNRVSITKDGIRTINSAILGGIIAYRSNYAPGYLATAGIYFKYGRSRDTDCGALEFLWYSGSEDVFNSFDDFKQKYDDGSIQRISSLSLGGERATSYCTVLELLKTGRRYGFAIASPTYNGTRNTSSSTSGNIQHLYGLSYYELEYNSYNVPVLNIRGAVVIEPWSNNLGGIFWHAGTRDTNPTYWHEGSSYDICGIVPKVNPVYHDTYRAYDTNILGSLYINGNLVSSSSSRRYKECIDDLTLEELDPHKLLNLPVRQGRYKKEYNEYKLQHLDMAGRILPMFIAEEVDEIYPAATIHDNETGEIESWDERLIIPGMLALIQEQDKKIKDLESRLEKMERVIMNLSNDGR